MRLLQTLVALAATTVTTVSALNILVNNDDGFGSANIRELYRVLVADGHSVVMVAPVDNESGQGGRSVYTDAANLTTASEYGLIPAGAPSLGRDPNDPDIWYYNGTPAACTFVALDWVLPQFYSNRSTDLLVAGPNFGTNLGAFVWTLSGTAGATYAAVTRDIPAIAFSAGNTEQRSYQWINASTPSGKPDPATVSANLALSIVRALANNTQPGSRLLPLGYGLNVNWPTIDTLSDSSTCSSPPFYQTRMSGGGAVTDKAVRNATTGTFHYGNMLTDALNTCINGNCSLPGETAVVSAGCYGSVSTFTIDYDGPSGDAEAGVRAKLAGVAVSGEPPAAVRRRESLGRRRLEELTDRRHE